jgi:hypothetical protein
MANKNFNFLFYVAIALLTISLLIFVVNINKIYSITGYATDTGTINFSVETVTSVNFTTPVINFGSGQVASGEDICTIDTEAGTVTNGNWTANDTGLILENIGNQEVQLKLQSGKSATTLISGNVANGYTVNVTSAETGACLNESTGHKMKDSDVILGRDVNINTTNRIFCNNLSYIDSKDQITIHFTIMIPANSSTTGVVGDTITATATALG